MPRDPSAKVPLTLRLPERLRNDLENRAKANNRSLNSEVIAELENYGLQQDMVVARFGTHEIATFMQALSSCAVLAQIQTGGSFGSDPKTMGRAIAAMHAVLNAFRPNGAGADGEGQEPATETAAAAMEIARYAGPTFFAAQPVEEPYWLRAYIERMQGDPA